MRGSRIWRGVVLAFGAATLLSLAGVGLLLFPEPLFPHKVALGRLSLHSDRPFDPVAGRRILADVERRLGKTPPELTDHRSRYRIFVANTEWRRRFVFLWNYGAGGVNYYPIGGGVFLRQADIDRGRLLQNDGRRVAAPRTLAYFAAHEIGHTLVGRRAGVIGNWRLPRWVREGLSDYVGFGGEVDVDALAAQLRSGHPDLDPKTSGLYARYRLLVAHMLIREGWTVDRLLASHLPQADAERRLLTRTPPVGAAPQ